MIWDGRIRADARHIPLEDQCVQCCVTSPPYFGLRKYDVEGPQIGLESSIEEYVEEITMVFREVRRVLKDDGTLWLNIGDAWNSGTKSLRIASKNHSGNGYGKHGYWTNGDIAHRVLAAGLKRKDLIGLPWLIAFALRGDGWYLRQEIIWHKTQAMPESVNDRPTRNHDQIFLLSKKATYFYDAEAIKEPASLDTHARYARGRSGNSTYPGNQTIAKTFEHMKTPAGWQTGSGSHDTIEHNSGPRTKQSQSPDRRARGFNEKWKKRQPGVHPKAAEVEAGDHHGRPRANESFSAAVVDVVDRVHKRSVWSFPTAPFPEAHYATFPPALIEPCILAGSRPGDIVLDPFFGSGTTGVVCERFSRRWIGIDLGYQDMQKRRLKNIQKELL